MDDERLRRLDEVMTRNEIAFRDLRAFLGEQTLALQGLTRAIQVLAQEVQGLTREIQVLGREMVRRTDEVLAEGRAQRQALFRILDRLDGKGGEAPG